MDSLMDNCSFLKKDIDASAITWNLYAFKYLVKKGRIRPDDKDFRNEMMTSPEYLTRWEREHEYLYDFSNRKSLTWQDFVDNTLTSNMHEG